MKFFSFLLYCYTHTQERQTDSTKQEENDPKSASSVCSAWSFFGRLEVNNKTSIFPSSYKTSKKGKGEQRQVSETSYIKTKAIGWCAVVTVSRIVCRTGVCVSGTVKEKLFSSFFLRYAVCTLTTRGRRTRANRPHDEVFFLLQQGKQQQRITTINYTFNN